MRRKKSWIFAIKSWENEEAGSVCQKRSWKRRSHLSCQIFFWRWWCGLCRPRLSFISFAYIDCKLVKSTKGLINYHSHKPFRNSNWVCLGTYQKEFPRFFSVPFLNIQRWYFLGTKKYKGLRKSQASTGLYSIHNRPLCVNAVNVIVFSKRFSAWLRYM